MNFCKCCGKEIPEGRKFCNSSCAAKYNNKHRTRKPWSEKQRKRVQVPEEQQICKYCGKKLVQGERRVCSECRKYRRFYRITARLVDCTGTPKENYVKALEKLKRLYSQGESTLTLESKLGIPKETIWYSLKNTGVVRDFSEANIVRIKQGREKIREGNPKYKHGWHTTWEGIQVYYRSSYELEFAKKLDSERVPYRMEYKPTFTLYFDSQRNKSRVAKPDFYLPETRELIEIKSRFTYNTQNMVDKFKAYRQAGFRPKLILEGIETEI